MSSIPRISLYLDYLLRKERSPKETGGFGQNQDLCPARLGSDFSSFEKRKDLKKQNIDRKWQFEEWTLRSEKLCCSFKIVFYFNSEFDKRERKKNRSSLVNMHKEGNQFSRITWSGWSSVHNLLSQKHYLPSFYMYFWFSKFLQNQLLKTLKFYLI